MVIVRFCWRHNPQFRFWNDRYFHMHRLITSIESQQSYKPDDHSFIYLCTCTGKGSSFIMRHAILHPSYYTFNFFRWKFFERHAKLFVRKTILLWLLFDKLARDLPRSPIIVYVWHISSCQVMLTGSRRKRSASEQDAMASILLSEVKQNGGRRCGAFEFSWFPVNKMLVNDVFLL